jgi:hypothetical protein
MLTFAPSSFSWTTEARCRNASDALSESKRSSLERYPDHEDAACAETPSRRAAA